LSGRDFPEMPVGRLLVRVRELQYAGILSSRGADLKPEGRPFALKPQGSEIVGQP